MFKDFVHMIWPATLILALAVTTGCGKDSIDRPDIAIAKVHRISRVPEVDASAFEGRFAVTTVEIAPSGVALIIKGKALADLGAPMDIAAHAELFDKAGGAMGKAPVTFYGENAQNGPPGPIAAGENIEIFVDVTRARVDQDPARLVLKPGGAATTQPQ